MVETATIILVIVEDPWTFGYKLHVYRQIRRPTVAIKSQNANQKSIFLNDLKVKSPNQKSRVGSRTKKSTQKVNFQLEKSKSKIKSRFLT